MANERNVETTIDKILNQKGWIDDINNPNRNVFKQEFKNKKLNKQKNGKPDYSLYDEEKCIAIIEAKKSNENLKKALDQARKYAKIAQAKVIFAYDGNVLKSEFIATSSPLYENNIEIDSFITKDKLLKFIYENTNNIQTNILNISQSELIKKFKKIDELLKDSSLEAGHERFTNLSTLIFIKIYDDLKYKNKNWNLLKSQEIDINYINKSVIYQLNEKYGKEKIFSEITIPNEYINNLIKIIKILDEIDFDRIQNDVKGGAYEYFLSRYNAGAKDLAQYYTPRHLINFMVKFLNPRIKDKIYDPFCGTGGMLIVAFNHLKEKIENEIKKNERKSFLFRLEKETIYGREFTKIASIAKMNMILIGDGHSNIERGDTFSKNIKSKYNIVLTNIPFGTKTNNKFAENHGLNGDVKEKKFLGEPTALMHIVNSLKKGKGKASIIVPTGVLYRTYKNDRAARQKLINNGLRFIINLPQNIFLPYTASQTSILFLDNSNNNQKKDFIAFFELNNDGYTLDTKRKKINGFNDLDKILMEYDYLEDYYKKYNFINYLKIIDIEEKHFNLYYNDYKNDAPKIGNFKKYIKLSKICKIFQGPAGTYMQQKKYTKSGELKVYEQIHAIKKDLDINKERFISYDYSNELQNHKFEIINNDILMTMSGTVGETIIYTNKYKKGVISTALSIIRVENEKKFLPKFINIILKNNLIKKWLKSKIKGTANKGIRLGDVKDILIPKISIKKQIEKIEKIEKSENLIMNHKEKIKKENEYINKKIWEV